MDTVLSTFTATREPCSPELTAHMSELNRFYFYVCGRLVMSLDLGELAVRRGHPVCPRSCMPPLITQGPGASWSQGRSWAVFVDLAFLLLHSAPRWVRLV